MKLTPTRKHFLNEIGLRRRASESLATLKASKLPRVAAAIAATASPIARYLDVLAKSESDETVKKTKVLALVKAMPGIGAV